MYDFNFIPIEIFIDFVDRIQSRALKLIGHDSVASSISSLGHRRNVSCIAPFINTILALIPPTQVFTKNTRLSARSH